MDRPDSILTALPARLKAARQARGLSLDAVSNLSGVSRSMVSQIERGESSPTIVTLWKLTQALTVDIAELMAPVPQGDRIDTLRASDVPTIDTVGQGCSIAILSPPKDVGRHEIYDIQFAEGGVLTSQPHARGAAEHLSVLEGRVRVTSGTAISDLAQGDTARYAADVPHQIAALEGPARVFLIVKAPER